MRIYPLREYAIPLQRERWRAQRDGEGATLPKVATVATLLRNDTMPDKTVGLNLSADVGHFTCYRGNFKI